MGLLGIFACMSSTNGHQYTFSTTTISAHKKCPPVVLVYEKKHLLVEQILAFDIKDVS